MPSDDGAARAVLEELQAARSRGVALREEADKARASAVAEARTEGVEPSAFLARDEVFERIDALYQAADAQADVIAGLEAKHARIAGAWDGSGPSMPDSGKPKGRGASGQGLGFASFGQELVESAGYRALLGMAQNGGKFSSKFSVSMEVESWADQLARLHATVGTVASPNLIQPDFQPGIVPILFRRLTVADLMPNLTTDSNLIRYPKETTADNQAAAVSEGGLKPQSNLVFDVADEPVRKVATYVKVADEFLSDVSAMRGYVDTRLRLFVLLEEEDQLLNGNGTAPNISGIRDRTGLQTDQPLGGDTRPDAIHKMMTKIRNSFLEPDAVVVHPNDWEQIILEKDGNEQYYGPGPFTGPYGTGQLGSTPPIWGLRTVVTPAIDEGTALVGAFALGAAIFRNGGLTVEATNSNEDDFIHDLTAIRAEERLALAVYREAAFGEVTGL